MENNFVPRLCGGTFFTLLLEAAKKGLKDRQKWGDSSEFTESDVLEALLKVAIASYERPPDADNYKSVVSAYKSCNVTKSGRLPINEQAHISTFNNRVKSNYQAPLNDMTMLIEKYIDLNGKGEWLLRAVFELAYGDENFNLAEKLYVSQCGNPITRSEFFSETNICLPAFLLGIWHFIVVKEIDNGIGKDTYNEWCKPGESKNTREAFRSSIGENIAQALNYFMPKTSGDDDITVDDEPFVDFGNSSSEQSTANPNATTQIVNTPAMFINNGSNVIQVNNTGVLNIDRSGIVEK